MDGLIFDTERLYLHAWPHVGTVLGLPITLEDATTTVGRPLWECEPFFQTRYGSDFCMTKALDIMAGHIRTQLETNGMPLKPGVTALLEHLRETNIPTALGTSNITSVVTAYLEAADLTPYFSPIVTADMVESAKPAPDIFQKAAADLGLRPDQCLVLEDSNIGIASAHKAGCLPVMVPDLLAPTAETLTQVWGVFDHLGAVTETLFSP